METSIPFVFETDLFILLCARISPESCVVCKTWKTFCNLLHFTVHYYSTYMV